ncbi:MAG: cytochrome P450 [Actinobacteria bacterium]|nr:cytochrome P450 [Actinomycetota bacterium]
MPTLTDVDLTNLDTFVEGVPHDQFDLLRREAPAYFHPEADGAGFWCITRRDDLRQLSHDWQQYSSEWGITIDEVDDDQLEQQRLMMLMMDPPKHTKLRLLVNKGFTPRMIGRLHERIREIASDIVDKIADRGECDFVVDVAAELPLQVIAEMMGVPQEDRHKVFEWSNRMIGNQDPEYAVSDDDVQEAFVEMFAYANDLATEKRANPGDDIISVLLDADVEGERLTDLEFDVFFELLAVAGNETTRNLISHGMLALIEHPDQRAKLLADMSQLPVAVDEMLRYASPVMYMRRTAQSDMTLHGETIKKGDKVALWYIAADHDPDVFDNPHTFDISRTPADDFVAFGGGGPHFCLGSHLARLEIQVMFEELLTRIPEMELAGPVERLRSNFINGIKHMPVTFTKTRPIGKD